MSEKEIEARLRTLEQQVAELQQQLQKAPQPANWVRAISGHFKDDPAWEEICRLGAELRKADIMTYEDLDD